MKRGSRKIESIDREESQSASPSAHELLQPIITVSQLPAGEEFILPTIVTLFRARAINDRRDDDGKSQSVSCALAITISR